VNNYFINPASIYITLLSSEYPASTGNWPKKIPSSIQLLFKCRY